MSSECVPELDASVCSASTTHQQSVLVWRPCQCLDSCLMCFELVLWLVQFLDVPDHEFVVIATGCELLILVAPLESTDFLFVADKVLE